MSQVAFLTNQVVTRSLEHERSFLSCGKNAAAKFDKEEVSSSRSKKNNCLTSKMTRLKV